MKRLSLPVRFLVLSCLICFFPGLVFANPEQQNIDKLIRSLKSANRAEQVATTNELIKIGSPALPELIKYLDDPNPQLQEFAAGILGNIEDKKAVPALLNALSKNPPRRYAVVWALGKIKDEQAIPYLIEEFRSDDASVQKTSMRAIIMIGSPAIPYLIENISDPDPRVRTLIVTLLGEMGVMSAEDLVISVLDDPDEQVVEAACRSLGSIGSSRSVPPLSVMVMDKNWRIRINAINSLGLIGDKTPIGLLEETIHDPRFIVREWSARALENITGNRYLYLNEQDEMVHPYNMYR